MIQNTRASRTALAFLLTVTLAPSVSAQFVTDGSIYSRFGIGELRQSATSQAAAMGGGGTAFRGALYTNFANPAAYGDLVLTSLAAGVNYQTVSARDALDNHGRLSSGNLSFLQFSLPLKAQKLGIGATFAPYSVSRYRVRVSSAVQLPSDTTAYTIDYGGSGGLQQATFAVGYTINSHVSVGATGMGLFGAIEESQETNFENASYTRSILSSSTRLRGFSGSVGVLGSAKNLLRENDRVTVGMTYSFPVNLQADRVLTSGDPQERDTLNSAITGDLSIPSSLAIGLHYRASSHVSVIADVLSQRWSGFSSTVTLPGYVPDAAGNNIRDRVRLSGGVEWLPAGNDALAGYAARIAYRFGVFYDQSYISPSASMAIDAIGATGGLSLPTLVPGTRIDINLEVGQRGTTDNGLVKDRFFKIGLNVNVGERWFLKQRLG